MNARRVAMARTELAAPTPPKHSEGPGRKARSAFGGAGDRITLAVHRLTRRLDLTPPEFGRDSTVDETDAASVRAEWLRHFRLWAAYNPEEVFALQVGGALLAAAIIALWLAIAIFL